MGRVHSSYLKNEAYQQGCEAGLAGTGFIRWPSAKFCNVYSLYLNHLTSCNKTVRAQIGQVGQPGQLGQSIEAILQVWRIQ